METDKTLIEKMQAVAHEIVDSLLECAPAELERKTAALRNLQAAISDGLGSQDTADPSAAVAQLLALEIQEKQVELREREARMKLKDNQ